MWGIEVSEESVACALENAELNGITNAAFFAGNVGQVVEELLERSGAPDVVVVDPPRAGLAGKALRRLGRLGAPRLVYVSCNPTTLAGDVKALREEYGYELLRATPVDMFPHTPHVECGRAARAWRTWPRARSSAQRGASCAPAMRGPPARGEARQQGRRGVAACAGRGTIQPRSASQAVLSAPARSRTVRPASRPVSDGGGWRHRRNRT